MIIISAQKYPLSSSNPEIANRNSTALISELISHAKQNLSVTSTSTCPQLDHWIHNQQRSLAIAIGRQQNGITSNILSPPPIYPIDLPVKHRRVVINLFLAKRQLLDSKINFLNFADVILNDNKRKLTSIFQKDVSILIHGRSVYEGVISSRSDQRCRWVQLSTADP